MPSLASSWTVEENDIGGDTYTFTLRENVRFHDESPWNCDVAKLNFDHLLEGALRSQHGWYGVPLYTEDWFCNSDVEFVLRTNYKHGPYLQELTFIRPIRMISPAAFVNDNATDATLANSCHLDWGVIDGNDIVEDVVCAGIAGVYGTGPFIFDSRKTVTVSIPDGNTEDLDNEVLFTAFGDYWGGAPAIKRLEIKRYETSDEVKAALYLRLRIASNIKSLFVCFIRPIFRMSFCYSTRACHPLMISMSAKQSSILSTRHHLSRKN